MNPVSSPPRSSASTATTAATPPVGPEAGGAWVLAALLFASGCIIVGLLWDISWHMSIGRDTLWSPPHVLEQVGAALAGVACGFLVLRTTFAGNAAQLGQSVRFWGFRGPLGAWVAIWGAFAMAFSVPFDDWWHNAYGLDVEILSPPHVILLFGMIAIQVGAMLLALGYQNRAGSDRRAGFGWAYAFAAGALMAMVLTASSEYLLQPNLWHGSLFYKIAALAFPLFLAAIARSGRLRFPATAAALMFTVVFLVPQWVIVQFPAVPRLSPIVNPITNMQAFGFPLLLLAPAVVFDLVVAGWRSRSDWLLAPVLGAGFVATMVIVHWPFAEFLVRSPLAQNHLFAFDHWAYFNGPGEYRTRFWDLDLVNGSWSPTAFVIGLGVAVLIGSASARVGLWWGNWMRLVRR